MWKRVKGMFIWGWKQAKIKERDKTTKTIGTNSDGSRDTVHGGSRERQDLSKTGASVLLHAVLLFVHHVPHSPYCKAQHEEASRNEWDIAELYITKELWGLQVNAHTSCRAKDTYRATDAVAAAGQREVNMGPTYTWEKQRGKLTASWMRGCACVQNEP